MHRIVIDLQVAQSADSGHRGLGRYAVEMTPGSLTALSRSDANVAGAGVAMRTSVPHLREKANGLLRYDGRSRQPNQVGCRLGAFAC